MPEPQPSYMETRFFFFWNKLNIPYGLLPQYPIGPFYADFAHPNAAPGDETGGVVIEIDGAAYHSSPDQRARDAYRQEYIESQGWVVIRFSGTEVYHYPVRCVLKARDLIEETIVRNPHETPKKTGS